jgi:hypothetical protein|tara:strand:+ start:410 stop:1150 length:741 start_codon:yes stop_codon:yes gene_type:complete
MSIENQATAADHISIPLSPSSAVAAGGVDIATFSSSPAGNCWIRQHVCNSWPESIELSCPVINTLYPPIDITSSVLAKSTECNGGRTILSSGFVEISTVPLSAFNYSVLFLVRPIGGHTELHNITVQNRSDAPPRIEELVVDSGAYGEWPLNDTSFVADAAAVTPKDADGNTAIFIMGTFADDSGGAVKSMLVIAGLFDTLRFDTTDLTSSGFVAVQLANSLNGMVGRFFNGTHTCSVRTRSEDLC